MLALELVDQVALAEAVALASDHDAAEIDRALCPDLGTDRIAERIVDRHARELELHRAEIGLVGLLLEQLVDRLDRIARNAAVDRHQTLRVVEQLLERPAELALDGVAPGRPHLDHARAHLRQQQPERGRVAAALEVLLEKADELKELGLRNLEKLAFEVGEIFLGPGHSCAPFSFSSRSMWSKSIPMVAAPSPLTGLICLRRLLTRLNQVS